MIDISIIIFFASLISITTLFVIQNSKLKNKGDVQTVENSKDLSYANFKILNNKFKKIWLSSIHTIFIIISKLWARFTHYVSSIFHKSFNKIEEQLIKHEKKNKETNTTSQSLFITTIKSYKNEIKKLKNKVEEELPRPRAEKKTKDIIIDKSDDINTID
jgi:hypothetical protein